MADVIPATQIPLPRHATGRPATSPRDGRRHGRHAAGRVPVARHQTLGNAIDWLAELRDGEGGEAGEAGPAAGGSAPEYPEYAAPPAAWPAAAADDPDDPDDLADPYYPADPEYASPDLPPTEPAVIGDELRLPIAWCEMGSCISHHADPDALGEADIRARAIESGWRVDALGRLACPQCQQSSSSFWATRPVVVWDRDRAVRMAARMARPDQGPRR